MRTFYFLKKYTDVYLYKIFVGETANQFGYPEKSAQPSL